MIVLKWILRLTAAIIMLQTLFFKFTAAPESVYIFTQLGMEPYGRIGTGIVELIAGALLLYPPTTSIGAVLGLGLMGGAIMSHLTQLGINVQGDGGSLFALAVITFVCCAILALLERKSLPIIGRFF